MKMGFSGLGSLGLYDRYYYLR